MLEVNRSIIKIALGYNAIEPTVMQAISRALVVNINQIIDDELPLFAKYQLVKRLEFYQGILEEEYHAIFQVYQQQSNLEQIIDELTEKFNHLSEKFVDKISEFFMETLDQDSSATFESFDINLAKMITQMVPKEDFYFLQRVLLDVGKMEAKFEDWPAENILGYMHDTYCE